MGLHMLCRHAHHILIEDFIPSQRRPPISPNPGISLLQIQKENDLIHSSLISVNFKTFIIMRNQSHVSSVSDCYICV